ncbi:MAG: NifB/NifX family molybdenum-iron cluster-binding protein [Deltaproteobacteria bacterium]|nr:NifB/NifX family molybdenum-iron cluster-binding protein [Deltaproteobacteria bacterium]
MKIAISSTGKDLDSQIDPRFGRCAYFLIVETDDMSFEAFDNENIALGGGAGIQSAQFIASKGAKAVITGNCGPNAVRTLSAAGVELFVGQTKTVKEALEDYKNGKLRTTTDANVPDHYGMGGGEPVVNAQEQAPGMGMGRGMGGGRGMGRGMGRGGGQGMGRGTGLKK